jgi:hypothetical protein
VESKRLSLPSEDIASNILFPIFYYIYFSQFGAIFKNILWLEFCDDINYWSSVSIEVALIGFKLFPEIEKFY